MLVYVCIHIYIYIYGLQVFRCVVCMLNALDLYFGGVPNEQKTINALSIADICYEWGKENTP